MRPLRVAVLPLVFAWGISASAEVASTNNTFSKYQVIIDKSPFRKGGSAAPTTAIPVFQGLVLKGVVCGDALKKVWIQDTKAGKMYYVSEGERVVVDCKVESIDCENQTAVLSQGITTATLAFISKGQNTPGASPTSLRPMYHGPARSTSSAAPPVPTPPSSTPVAAP